MSSSRNQQPNDKEQRPQRKQSAPLPRPPPPPPDVIPPNFKPVFRIWLVRHGETEENVQGIVQGTMDTELNAHGIHQAQLVADVMKDLPFRAVLTSDLRRASVTADIIASKHPDLRVLVDPGLRERCCGEREGMPPEIYRMKKAQIKDFGESDEVFGGRIWAWWCSFIKALESWAQSRNPIDILLVSHGAYITGLVRDLVFSKHVLNPRRFRLDGIYNTGVTCIDMDQGLVGVLRVYNNVRHLPRAEPIVKENVDAESVPEKDKQVKTGTADIPAPAISPGPAPA